MNKQNNFRTVKQTSVISLLMAILSGCSSGEKAEFWVRGNCEMCEARIESVLTATPGVNSADWNVDSKIVTVFYDSTKVSVEKLNEAVAKSGHGTRNIKEDSVNYWKLPKCCLKPEDM